MHTVAQSDTAPSPIVHAPVLSASDGPRCRFVQICLSSFDNADATVRKDRRAVVARYRYCQASIAVPIVVLEQELLHADQVDCGIKLES